MRARKEEGEFETYREAYRWAEKNISKKGLTITAHRLERAYHKAKSEGKVGEEKASKVSIPLYDYKQNEDGLTNFRVE